jgi:hypothetical protein
MKIFQTMAFFVIDPQKIYKENMGENLACIFGSLLLLELFEKIMPTYLTLRTIWQNLRTIRQKA